MNKGKCVQVIKTTYRIKAAFHFKGKGTAKSPGGTMRSSDLSLLTGLSLTPFYCTGEAGAKGPGGAVP